MSYIDRVIDAINNSPQQGDDRVPLGAECDKSVFAKMALYANRFNRPEHIAAMYMNITKGIINVKDLTRRPESGDIEVSRQLKGTAKQIVETNIARRRQAEANNFIRSLKENENLIINEDELSELRLHRCMNVCDTPKKNMIYKYIIFRALIKRYERHNAANPKLFVFIMEFMHIMRRLINTETVAGGGANATAPAAPTSVPAPTGRASQREALRARQIGRDVYEYPTAADIVAEDMDVGMRNSIMYYVGRADTILQRHSFDVIRCQMVDNYDRLYPLNTWDKKVYELDDWQKVAIDHINNGRSMVITAPTSSGKTVIAQYCGVNYKTLFVVPNNVLALQVAGSFHNAELGEFLADDSTSYFSFERKNIVVGTPETVEMMINQHNLFDYFQYLVMDEIHDLNGDNGRFMERILKLVRCPVIILSATLENAGQLCNYLREVIVGGDVEHIDYNRRFIVLQKYLFDGTQLSKLHPIACLTPDNLTDGTINYGNFEMTAYDTYVLGMKIHQMHPEYNTNPYTYFDPNVAITLDCVKRYESRLKDVMMLMAADGDELLRDFRVNPANLWSSTDYVESMIKMFDEMKSNNMTPALVYMNEDIDVMMVFKALIERLEHRESLYFTEYKAALEWFYGELRKFGQSEEKFVSDKSKEMNKNANSPQVRNELSNYRKNFTCRLLELLGGKYDRMRVNTLANNNYTEAEKEMIVSFLEKDIADKAEYMYHSRKANTMFEMGEINPYAPIYTYHDTSLSVERMREIRNSISNFSDTRVEYTNIYLRGIERGILAFTEALSKPFLNFANELIANKNVPICLSGKLLIYGVNLPIRTTVIAGTNRNGNDLESIDTITAHQVQGRAGRRGIDTKGNVVYMKVDIRNIMMGRYMSIVGCENILNEYSLLPLKLLAGANIDAREYVARLTRIGLSNYVRRMDWFPEVYCHKVELRVQDTTDGMNQYGLNQYLTYLMWVFYDKPEFMRNTWMMVIDFGAGLRNFGYREATNTFVIDENTMAVAIRMLCECYDGLEVYEAIRTNAYTATVELSNKLNQVIKYVRRLYQVYINYGNLMMVSILHMGLYELYKFRDKMCLN